MSDETTKSILGDAATSSVEEPGRKRFLFEKSRAPAADSLRKLRHAIKWQVLFGLRTRRDRGRPRKEESNARAAGERRKGIENSASGDSEQDRTGYQAQGNAHRDSHDGKRTGQRA